MLGMIVKSSFQLLIDQLTDLFEGDRQFQVSSRYFILKKTIEISQMTEITVDSNKRKLLSGLCHGSIFFSSLIVSVGIPLIILLISDDLVVRDNAKEALNFHFNMWFYGFVFWLLTFVLIGFLLLPILILISFIMPILAVFKILNDSDMVYRYPFLIRVL
jgi:hypothetical protein